MAEAGPSINFTYLKNHVGNCETKKLHNKIQENIDDLINRNFIIMKRPPRRPKLEKESEALDISIQQPTDNNEIVIQTTENNAIQNAEKISQIVQIEQIIKQTGEQISLLHLNQKLLDKTENTSLILDKFIKGKNTKTIKKLKKQNKNKNEIIEHEKIELCNTNEGSINTLDNKESIKNKIEQEKHNHNRYIKIIRSDTLKLQQSTSEENDSQGNSGKSDNTKEQKVSKEKNKGKRKEFCEHLPVDVVKKILAVQDPEKPNTIEGNIRINPRCYQNAYISLNTGEKDVVIIGLKDRNRALEGDLVAVIINPQDKWFELNDNTAQKTGTVVSILKKVHPRKAVGSLKKQDVFVCLQPRDSRIPLIKINPRTVPRNFYDNPDLFKETLFLCKIVDWKKVAFAEGEIQQIIGNKGDISVETNAILLENDLFLTPYDDELLKDLPPADYILSESDILDREDLRKMCTFTIDMEGSKDLDNALSCKLLGNGNFEVGVHISDVTYFLKAFSSLDEKVSERATSVYMVDNVYQMLPEQLTLVCSLLPDKDKLTFSVIFEMTSAAKIVNYRFSKTVINSCCKMTYEQAQIMIDDNLHNWKKDNSLKIYGNYDSSILSKKIRNLYNLSIKLKKKRFDAGALRIDQPKLCVFLDKETRLPTSFKLEEKKEANSLIEEFALLTNMTVAKHLYEKFPEVTVLSIHAKPSMQILSKIQHLLTKFGVFLNIESSGSLHSSLLKYGFNSTKNLNNSTDVAQYRMMVINNLCMKSMMKAEYKCSGLVNSKDDLRHYALNIGFYTHFTSPIRRYCDCIIHRLLHASIKNQPLSSEWSSSLCAKMATNCSRKKYLAKTAQEQSRVLFFTYMLDLRGSMNTQAVVIDVKERSADAILCDTGLKIRLYFSDTVEETKSEFKIENDVPIVQLIWTNQQIVQIINIFSVLNVKITKHPQLFRLQGIILQPVKMDED